VNEHPLAHWSDGETAHVAHGGVKVAPHAIGLDTLRVDPIDWITDPRDLWCCESQRFDTVLLTPDWISVRTPRRLLTEALRITRVGGKLVVAAPPRDLTALLAGVDVVHDDSTVLVVRKRAGHSWFVEADARLAPAASVLIVSEVHDPEEAEVQRLRATIIAAQSSLGSTPHEILVLLRFRPSPDALAELHELAAQIPECRIDEDLAPHRVGARLERLRRSARGDQIIVLASGALPCEDALHTLSTRASGSTLAVPRYFDHDGGEVRPHLAPGTCVLVPRALWPHGHLADSPYQSHDLWIAWQAEHPPETIESSTVITDGWGGRPLCGSGPGQLTFDGQLLERRVPVAGAPASRRTLVVALRTMGDCILATASIGALRNHAPPGEIVVATEEPYGWIFRNHPAVDEVVLVPPIQGDDVFWQEQEIIATLIERSTFDELLVLSDRLDNVPYFRSGMTFAAFYATQAGVPETAERGFELALTPEDHDRAGDMLRAHGIDGDYVVTHTRAGWPERTPTPELFEAVRATVVNRHGLPLVVIGGPGEALAGDGIVNLAGTVPAEVSAAIIASARLFVGPDSGSMHMASAYDVPTLGLYGGTSLRLVPPQATRSVAVQSTTSCPRPCGLTPCAVSTCGMSGIDEAKVASIVNALLARREVIGEWFGSAPARIVHGPEGAVVVQTEAPLLSPPTAPPTVYRREITARDGRAPEIKLAWRRNLERAAELQRGLLARRGGKVSLRSLAPNRQKPSLAGQTPR